MKWVLVLLLLAVAGVGYVAQLGSTANATFTTMDGKTYDFTQGADCLDPSIGSLHADFWLAVKRRLHDPDSMQDKRMTAGPPDASGIREIRFTFRSKNVYGALQLSDAVGRVNASDCRLIDWKLL